MLKKCLAVLMPFVLVSCGQGDVDENIVIDNNSKVIDVRTEKEYQAGHLKNAINIPHTMIKEKIEDYVKDKDERIALYCHSGRRSGIAQNILKEMGYKNVINAGAYEKLKKQEEERERQKE